MLPRLTEREKKVLYVIRMWQFRKRYSPCITDIAQLMGVHRSTVGHVFSVLKKKGYIEVSPHKNWQKKVVLFPKNMDFAWGSDELPYDVFEKSKEQPVNSNSPSDGV